MKMIIYIVCGISFLHIGFCEEVDVFKDMDPVTRIRVLKQFDKDGDGMLSAEEKAIAVKVISQGGSLPESDSKKVHAVSMLGKYDLNKNGVLDASELEELIEDQRKLFDEFNKDIHGRPIPKEVVAKYDKNGDGVLDSNERFKMRSDMAAQRSASEKK